MISLYCITMIAQLYEFVKEKIMLAENIKKYRKKLKLTQEKLAREADISYSTVIKLESGEIADPRMETLKKIAKALGVSIDKLVRQDVDTIDKGYRHERSY